MDFDRCVAIRGAAVAELPKIVPTPTAHGTGIEQRAAMTIAKSDSAGVVDSADADGRMAIRGGAVAEWAIKIQTPTAQGAGIEHRAAMIPGKSDSDALQNAIC